MPELSKEQLEGIELKKQQIQFMSESEVKNEIIELIKTLYYLDNQYKAAIAAEWKIDTDEF
jgi:hypothetical protein